MLQYKILIRLFAINCVSEGCARDVYIVSPSKKCGSVVSAGPTVPSPPPFPVVLMTVLVATADGYFNVVVYCMV